MLSRRDTRIAVARTKRIIEKRIDDILEQREKCLHLKTRIYIEPAAIEGSGDRVIEGSSYKRCRDCMVIVGWL